MNHVTSNSDSDEVAWQKLTATLTEEIQRAVEEVYKLDSITPVEKLSHGGFELFVKREDRSLIHSYKWRGAYFKMQTLVEHGAEGRFVAASAGNHAQGVALAAAKLKKRATIFMPQTTPALKIEAVKKFGGEWVNVALIGDQFAEAAEAANQFAAENFATMVPPYDDLQVIAGQATVGMELTQQVPGLDVVFVPIGGGGLASGLSFALKNLLKSSAKVIGVEVENQNAMHRSSAAAQRTRLYDVDRFCDGTAVHIPGKLTYQICHRLLDSIVLVSNHEVSRAAQFAWEASRFIPEPSGAIALAGALKFGEPTQCNLAIVSGSNTDFRTLSRFVQMSAITDQRRRYYRFEIAEEKGSLIDLLDRFLGSMNIVDFQYGKADCQNAFPVLGIESTEAELDCFEARIRDCDIGWQKMDCTQFTEFRVIPHRLELCKEALFFKIELPNRAGMLRELMRQISDFANICYFNFVDTGESEGRALIGFELCDGQNGAKLFEVFGKLSFRWNQVNILLNQFKRG